MWVMVLPQLLQLYCALFCWHSNVRDWHLPHGAVAGNAAVASWGCR